MKTKPEIAASYVFDECPFCKKDIMFEVWWNEQEVAIVEEKKTRRPRLRAEMKTAIVAFCEAHRWAYDSWEKSEHIKPLFDIAARLRAEKEGK